MEKDQPSGKFYSINLAQLVAVLIFGIILWFGVAIDAMESYDASMLQIILLVGIPFFLVFYTLGWRKHRPKKPKHLTSDGQKNEVAGIGGWLYLVGLGLIVAPFFNIGIISQILGVLPQTTSEAARSVLIFELAADFGLLALNGVAIYGLVEMKRWFPHVYAAFLLAGIAVLVVDNVIANMVFEFTTEENNETYSSIGGAVVGAVIWIPYVYISKRVKNTFVNR